MIIKKAVPRADCEEQSASSEPSPQLSIPSHFNLRGIHLDKHANWSFSQIPGHLLS